MENLTNIIEAILFVSGNSIAISDITEKLNVTEREVKEAFAELKLRYGADNGIQLLEFNKKAQFASNPIYKEEVAAVLNPIREKELTRTILETAAIVAYKQPITRTEIERLRGLNSEYAVRTLLANDLIYPCGRKDAVGRPVLYATTDEFLKRFKLNSLADLPDYDELMEAIAEQETPRDTYLYAREELPQEGSEEGSDADDPSGKRPAAEKKAKEETEGGYEIPDFLRGLDDTDIVKIS